MDNTANDTNPILERSSVYHLPPLEKCLHQFDVYRKSLSKKTLRAQYNDLRHFMAYLTFMEIPIGDLIHDPAAWSDVKMEQVYYFQLWQLNRGYSVHTVNRNLITIRQYAKFVSWNGFLSDVEYEKIRWSISTINTEKEFRNKEVQCRLARNDYPSVPQAHLHPINSDQAFALKSQPNTPQGRRDALIMCLLLDHGLKLKDLLGIQREDFDLENGSLQIQSGKNKDRQLYQLTEDGLQTAKQYLCQDAPAIGVIWRGSRKGSHGFTEDSMSARAMIERVRVLGQRVGLDDLRARDCLHYWKQGNSTDGKVSFKKNQETKHPPCSLSRKRNPNQMEFPF